MADGRMLVKDITTDPRMIKLTSHFSRLLFTWCIPFLDDEGYITADPERLALLIMPGFPDDHTMVSTCVTEWVDAKIVRVEGIPPNEKLHFIDFRKCQKGLWKYREQTKERVRKWREKQGKNVTLSNVTGDKCNAVTKCNAEVKRSEVKRSEEKRIEGKYKRIFTKPSLEEIKAYCQERKNTVIPDSFFDHYESNGWKVGKNAMKDWKATIRKWERNDFSVGGQSPIGKDQIKIGDRIFHKSEVE